VKPAVSTAAQQHKSEELAAWVSEQRSGQVEFYEKETRIDPLRGLRIRAGFRRHQDFDATNDMGQDFSQIRSDARFAVGLVVDGVSQSFFGDIAARGLGVPLFEYLWMYRSDPPESEELEHFLQKTSTQVAKAVEAFEIPEHVNGILKTVLEEARREGSQAVFSAFVWDVLTQQATVIKVGDCFASVVNNQGETKVQESDASGRFSSAGDTDLKLVCQAFENISAVFVATDGLTRNHALSADPERLTEDLFREAASELSRYDDVSFSYAERIGPVPSEEPPMSPKVPRTEHEPANQRLPSEVGKERRILHFAIPAFALLVGMLLGAVMFPIVFRVLQPLPTLNDTQEKSPEAKRVIAATSPVPQMPQEHVDLSSLPRDQVTEFLHDNPNEKRRIGTVFAEIDTSRGNPVSQIAFSYIAGYEKIHLAKDLVKDVRNWVVLPDLGDQQDVELEVNGNPKPTILKLQGWTGKVSADPVPGFYSITLSN